MFWKAIATTLHLNNQRHPYLVLDHHQWWSVDSQYDAVTLGTYTDWCLARALTFDGEKRAEWAEDDSRRVQVPRHREPQPTASCRWLVSIAAKRTRHDDSLVPDVMTSQQWSAVLVVDTAGFLSVVIFLTLFFVFSRSPISISSECKIYPQLNFFVLNPMWNNCGLRISTNSYPVHLLTYFVNVKYYTWNVKALYQRCS